MDALSGHAHPQNESTQAIRAYTRRFHNIYLFITERCQLRCGHCYMGERLDRGLTMSYERASSIIRYCHRLGAEYMTFVGGEPTLHPELGRLIEEASTTGYRKVMVDTNGLSVGPLSRIAPEKLYYVRVSIDGGSASTHERVRGPNTFEKTLQGIRTLRELGHQVRITCTLFRFNRHEIAQIMRLASELGVLVLNFHSFSEEGYGCANRDWSMSPEEWVETCGVIEDLKPRFALAVRYPPTWVKTKDLAKYISRGYRGCLGCSLDRLSIFPDGRCYVCSMLFDTKLNFAQMADSGMQLNKEANEYELFTAALLQAPEPALSGCPAEAVLKNQQVDGFVSVCRLWRTEI
jgi:molybdenum cofactor biosynthesis enzyme MoaA